MNAQIASGGGAPMFAANQVNSGELPYYVGGSIRRAVVDHENFNIVLRRTLSEQCFEAAAYG